MERYGGADFISAIEIEGSIFTNGSCKTSGRQSWKPYVSPTRRMMLRGDYDCKCIEKACGILQNIIAFHFFKSLWQQSLAPIVNLMWTLRYVSFAGNRKGAASGNDR